MSTKSQISRNKGKKRLFVDKKQNIARKRLFQEAGENLLRKVQDSESANAQDAEASWQEIETRLNEPRPTYKLRVRYIVSLVASIALLLSFGFYFWMNTEKDSSLSLALLENTPSPLSGDEILLIESKEKMQLKDESAIQYDENGKSDVGKNLVKKETAETISEKEEEINQILVPKGRKASITFSDGTKMYVNAGTRVFYPAIFQKDKREIVVEGEVYLEVKKDPSRPFIVKTNGFDVKVLGTQFNVCAYKEEASASVVLVEGRVEVAAGKKDKSVLSPNQMIQIDAKGTEIKEVDVFGYICWKDNMMLLNDRKVGEILNRLSRYYGRTILYTEEIGNIPISGKLDLRENMEEVIQIICQSFFLQYKTDVDNNIVISK